jgi:alkanesulfonate monooxygenase SsuD/methylene tetrahydromethanopterin reductase-like flavin-dependent oxidoreductase (luciferase family)
VQQPLPLYIGGDGPAALRRAATVGAGWMPMNHSLDELPASIERLHELAEAAGRTTPIEVTRNLPVTSVDDLKRYADLGITRVITSPWKRSSEALDAIARFADEILPSA